MRACSVRFQKNPAKGPQDKTAEANFSAEPGREDQASPLPPNHQTLRTAIGPAAECTDVLHLVAV